MGKTTEMVEVTTKMLKPYERNAKIHGKKQIEKLKDSIREFGFLSPCLIDKDYNIIAGHGRVMAAKELGMDKVPCVFIEGLTDEQRRAYILADNRLGELGEWDFEIVFDELKELEDLGFNVELTGFEMPEEGTEVIEDEFNEESVPEEPIVKPGDIWQLGDHRLMCGNSTSTEDIDRLINGEYIRLTVTSPPYGVGKDYEEKGISPWRETIQGVIDAIKGKTLIICWNIGDLFTTETQFTEPTGAYSVNMMAEAGYGMLYCRIWRKPGANFAGNNPYYTVTTKPAQDYEYLYAFAEKDHEKHIQHIKQYLFESAKKAGITNEIVKGLGGPSFMCGHWFTNHQWTLIDKDNYRRVQEYCLKNNIKAFERNYDELKLDYLKHTIFSHILTDQEFSDWGMYGVWEFNTVHERLGGHAAAFPLELPTRYIKVHSYIGDAVLDPFGGTGTTLIACEQLGRRCYMMELDPHYCDVIISRWEQFTGKKAVRIDD